MSASSRPFEKDVQAAIVEALRLAGAEVMQTSAWRQRGPSGVSPGVPDLLVFHPRVPRACLPLEVKRPGGRLSFQQTRYRDLGLIAVAFSVDQALEAFRDWLDRQLRCEPFGVRDTAVRQVERAAETAAAAGARRNEREDV